MRDNSSKGRSSRKTKAQLSEENDSLRRRVQELEQGPQGLEKGKRPDQLSEAVQRIYKEVPFGLCYLDTDLRYCHINEWLAALNGLSVEDHLGRSIGEVLPHVAAGVESQLRHVIEIGKPILGRTVDAETRAQPGVTRSFQHSYFPVRSDDGAVVGVSCVVEEITERKKVGKALQESEERLHGAIENLQEGFALFDAADRLIALNEEYRRVSPPAQRIMERGGTFEDVIRANVARGVIVEAKGREEEFIQERLKQHQNPKGSIIRRFTDGHCYMLREVRTPEGGIALSFIDITELQTVKEAKERLSQAVETVPVGIALFDRDDRLVFFNNRYAELMKVMADILKPGVTFEEMIRTMVERQPVKDARGREEEFIQERIKHHRNPTGPFDIRRDNMWLSADETRLADGSIFTIIIDITERKRMEEALVESEERHRHFSADVAHELRTPLAVLRSHLDNLENTETIQSLSKDVDAMSRLVSQLLATTQLDSFTVNPNDEADLHAIGTEVAKYLAPFAIKEGRSIEMTGTQHPVIVRGNGAALEMAVRNLVENAIRYSARESVVTIRVSDDPAISVINHGRGIPPEQQEVIFQRFRRADRRSGGAGLGLSIVQRVVEAHQATIDVSDASGGGTVFKISFPSPKA